MAFSEFEVAAESTYWHVNNVTLFDYLEQARSVWYQYCKSCGAQPMVVNININYKNEAFNHERLYIRTSIERVGNTSFTLKQSIVNEQKIPVVNAEVVLALIDLQTRQKISVPLEICRLLDQDTALDL